MSLLGHPGFCLCRWHLWLWSSVPRWHRGRHESDWSEVPRGQQACPDWNGCLNPPKSGSLLEAPSVASRLTLSCADTGPFLLSLLCIQENSTALWPGILGHLGPFPLLPVVPVSYTRWHYSPSVGADLKAFPHFYKALVTIKIVTRVWEIIAEHLPCASL